MNRKQARSRWAEILGHDAEITGHVGPKYPFSANGIHLGPMADGLSAWWPVDQAISIAERLARLIEEAEVPGRSLNNPQPDGFIDDMTARGERIVLCERPELIGR